MSAANRPNRKASDFELIRLNSVGLSLATIGQIVNCHPSTITQRLKGMGVQPADTRRSFMEDVFQSLTLQQQEWLADQLGPTLSIKDFVRGLIIQAFNNRKA